MDRNSAEVGWSDDQWERVLRTVAEEAQKARGAAQFLPITGPLDPTVEAVPPLTLGVQAVPAPIGASPLPGPPLPGRIWVDTEPTLPITTFSTLVYLRGPEVADPDLAAALGAFRRSANLIARAEDALIFRGRTAPDTAPVGIPGLFGGTMVTTGRGTNNGIFPPWIPPVLPPPPAVGVPPPAAVLGGRRLVDARDAGGPATGVSLVAAIIAAISDLEMIGHAGDFACVLADDWFSLVCTPGVNLVMPRDRILPFVDGRLYRSSTLPRQFGVVIALGGAPIETVLATELTVKFLNINSEPRYVFRVYERVAIRVKEENAISVLWG